MYIVCRKLEEREKKRKKERQRFEKMLNFRFRSYSKFNNLIKKKSVRELF